MKNSENIDKIFSEGLHAYERQPRTEAWGKLQARLEKKDSKVLPLWWKYASAASVALLLGMGGYWFINNSSNENSTVATISKVKIQPTIKSESAILNETKTEESVIAKTISPVAGTHLNAQSSPHVRKHTREIFSPVAGVPISLSPLAGVPTSPHVRKQTQELENQNNLIVALETIKPKTQSEENTIVLVLENTKPKKEEETIVLNFVDTKAETVAQNTEPEKKQSRVGKIWEQLKRAKNGENVNWGEVGVKPQKVLARADAKIENALTRGESNDR
jgi:hypothetical protein